MGWYGVVMELEEQREKNALLQAERDKLRLEFDAYRDKVKRLVEAAKMVEPSVDVLNSRRVDSSNPMSMLIAWNNVFSTLDNLNKAIADLEEV